MNDQWINIWRFLFFTFKIKTVFSDPWFHLNVYFEKKNCLCCSTEIQLKICSSFNVVAMHKEAHRRFETKIILPTCNLITMFLDMRLCIIVKNKSCLFLLMFVMDNDLSFPYHEITQNKKTSINSKNTCNWQTEKRAI